MWKHSKEQKVHENTSAWGCNFKELERKKKVIQLFAVQIIDMAKDLSGI